MEKITLFSSFQYVVLINIDLQQANMTFFLLILLITINAKDLIRVPVKGQVRKGYKATIMFGSEKIPMDLIVDTGSSLSVLQCIDCYKCNSKGNQGLYSYQQSITSKKLSCASHSPVCEGRCRLNQQFCEYKILYGEGTTVYGNIINDQIFIGNQSAGQFKGHFGCVDYEKNVRGQETNIMGLAPRPKQNMLYPLFESNQNLLYEFSTCFGENDGYMQVGRDKNYESKAPTWTSKFYTNSGLYILQDFESLKFGSLSVTRSKLPKGMIIDTGSSMFIFPKKMLDTIADEIFSRCQRLGGKCVLLPNTGKIIMFGLKGYKSFEMALADLDKNFPKIELTMNGVKTTIKPSEYILLQKEIETGTYVLRAGFSYLKETTEAVDSTAYEQIILGMIWLKNKKIVINLKEQSILAYYKQNCTYTDVPVEYDSQMLKMVMFAWDFLKTVDKSYLVLAVLAFILLVCLIKKYARTVAQKICDLNKSLANLCKRKKRKRVKKTNKANKSSIQLNEQSYRQQKNGVSELSKQKPTVPKTLKKRRQRRNV